MKKILLLLLLLPFMVEAQNLTRDEYLKGTVGKPTWTPNNNNAYAPDYTNQQVWRYNKTQGQWVVESDTNVIKMYLKTGINGRDGAQGVQGIQGEKGEQGLKGDKGDTGERGLQGIQGVKGEKGDTGSQGAVGATGAQGLQGVQGIKGDKGDQGLTGSQGIQGIKGDQGIQGVKGDKGDTGNCSNCPPNNGGSGTYGIYNVVNTNGVDDSQSWQTAVDSAFVNHKPIYAASNTIFSRTITIPKNIQNLVILGNGTEMRAKSATPFTFFAKPLPASVAEAEQVYTFSFIRIQDIIFKGNGQQQIGINLYAGGGHTYEKILGYSMKSVINLMFSMNARVVSCEAINSVYGFPCISGMGFEEFAGIPGATSSNSSPNKLTFWNCRVVGAPDQSSKYGFVVTDASGVSINDPILEGHYFSVSGIYWNSTATTADGAIIVNPHLEVANPCPKGFMYFRSGTSMHNIDGGGSSKAGIAVYVETPGTGYPQIKWSNIGSNKMKFNQGKVFHQAPGASWVFDYVDDPFTDAQTLAVFEGTISAGCNGANKFCIKKVVRNGGTSTQGRMASEDRKALRQAKREVKKMERVDRKAVN